MDIKVENHENGYVIKWGENAIVFDSYIVLPCGYVHVFYFDNKVATLSVDAANAITEFFNNKTTD